MAVFAIQAGLLSPFSSCLATLIVACSSRREESRPRKLCFQRPFRLSLPPRRHIPSQHFVFTSRGVYESCVCCSRGESGKAWVRRGGGTAPLWWWCEVLSPSPCPAPHPDGQQPLLIPPWASRCEECGWVPDQLPVPQLRPTSHKQGAAGSA